MLSSNSRARCAVVGHGQELELFVGQPCMKKRERAERCLHRWWGASPKDTIW